MSENMPTEPMEGEVPEFLRGPTGVDVVDDNAFKSGVYRLQVDKWLFLPGATGERRKLAAYQVHFIVLEGPPQYKVSGRKFSERFIIGNNDDPLALKYKDENPKENRMGAAPLREFLRAAGVVFQPGKTIDEAEALRSVSPGADGRPGRIVRADIAQRSAPGKDGSTRIFNNVRRKGWHPDEGPDAPPLEALANLDVDISQLFAKSATVTSTVSAPIDEPVEEVLA